MNSRLDTQSLMALNKADLQAAKDTMPIIVVQDQNWSAVIDLLERLCECQEELLKMQSELMTEEQMKKYLENQESHLRTIGNSLQSNSETDSGTVGTDADKSDKSVRKYEATGWENEPGILLSTEELRRMEVKARLENAQSSADFTIGAAYVIDGIAAVATVIEEPSDDNEFIYHEDSKLLCKERRHKEELGMKM